LTLCPKLPKDLPQQQTRQLLPYPATATQNRFDLVVHIVKQCINSDPPQPQIYGMPRLGMYKQIPPDQQSILVISNMLLSVELLMDLLRACEEGSLDDEQRRACSFNQITGLCLNYWLKSLGAYKQIN
ncbi:hypothetical protein, partial [Salmonella sp. s51228]|uniref:hypothetical protein n=1 Tax=Salmonella sp. s51228 TaxID=3159652 RepID=UPI003980DB01